MPFYAILIVGGVLALLGAFLLNGGRFSLRSTESARGVEGSDASDGTFVYGASADCDSDDVNLVGGG